MPKGRSKKNSNKAKPDSKGKPESKAAAKPKAGVRKQIRRLERELATAAAVELKRVRKLERAHHRLQRAEAALDELRGISAPEPAMQKPAGKKPAAAPKPAAAKPATATAKPTSPRARTTSAAKPAPKPAAAKPAAAAAPEEPKA